MTGKSKKQQNPHDHAYKLLFSRPEMIADLLRGYVRQPWVEQLDFSTLKRANPEHITGDLRWQAATSIETLIDTIPGGLEAYRPGFSYLLLDEGQYADDSLPDTRNLVSGLFSLENSCSPHGWYKL